MSAMRASASTAFDSLLCSPLEPGEGMGNLESLGDVVTGGILGHAVEPRTAEAGDHATGGTCLNCGAPLSGPYCHQCGQEANVHRTLAAFFHDLLHGVLHFEGKIWRTLPLLAWLPGDLTRRYIDGQRASFVSPIALFLFSVFLMFAVLGASLGLGNTVGSTRSRTELATSIAKDEQRLASLTRERAAAVAAGRPTAAFDSRIASVESDLSTERLVAASLNTANGAAKDQNGSTTPVIRTPRTGNAWLDSAIARAKQNPDLLIYKLKSGAYKYSWLLIPLSVPFLWLLFPFSRRFRVYDHIIFVTYSLSFMTLLVVAAALLGMVGLSAIGGFLLFLPPVHMYRQLQGTYGLTWLGALWRALLLTIFAFVAAALFAIIVAGIAA